MPVLNKLTAEGDELTGINIVKKAIEKPIRWIAENSGMEKTPPMPPGHHGMEY